MMIAQLNVAKLDNTDKWYADICDQYIWESNNKVPWCLLKLVQYTIAVQLCINLASSQEIH